MKIDITHYEADMLATAITREISRVTGIITDLAELDLRHNHCIMYRDALRDLLKTVTEGRSHV